MANNILFKGYFEYHFHGTLKDLFGEKLSEYYPEEIWTESISLLNNLEESTISVYKKDSEIPFEFGRWKNIEPENIITQYNAEISFILISKTLDIISVDSRQVVFIGNNNEVFVRELSRELHLFYEHT